MIITLHLKLKVQKNTETYKDDIIFSIGHTVATYEEAVEAVERGAKHVTHLYNAGDAIPT